MTQVIKPTKNLRKRILKTTMVDLISKSNKMEPN